MHWQIYNWGNLFGVCVWEKNLNISKRNPNILSSLVYWHFIQAWGMLWISFDDNIIIFINIQRIFRIFKTWIYSSRQCFACLKCGWNLFSSVQLLQQLIINGINQHAAIYSAFDIIQWHRLCVFRGLFLGKIGKRPLFRESWFICLTMSFKTFVYD